MAVLPTGFGKSMIYQSFVIEKDSRDSSSCCVLVIVPLKSIIDEQVKSNDFGLKAVAYENKDSLLKDIGDNKFQVIYASAEQALSREFTDLLKDDSSALKDNLSLVVVDECHTVQTW